MSTNQDTHRFTIVPIPLTGDADDPVFQAEVATAIAALARGFGIEDCWVDRIFPPSVVTDAAGAEVYDLAANSMTAVRIRVGANDYHKLPGATSSGSS